MTVHYLDAEERKVREQELKDRQANPENMLTLTFLRDESGWYADVPNHTRGQNSMVMGSDRLLDMMAQGDRRVDVKFRTVKPAKGDTRKPLFHLSRIFHATGYGANYLVHGLSLIPFPAYICDVGHDVIGEHAKDIYVYEINHCDC